MIEPLSWLTLNCRKIFIKDHILEMSIGAHDFEKERIQRVIFNIELFVPYANSAPINDKLQEVVDYDFVREVIKDFTKAKHIELQETLCDEITERLLKNPQVVAVRLSSSKPDVYPDCISVGVEVFRIKDIPA